MSVAQTSVSTYHDHVQGGKELTQCDQIVQWLSTQNKACTRREIHEGTGLEYGAVCGRVNKLVKDGLLTELQRKIENNGSGKKAKLVRIPLKEQQLGLFQ